LTLPHPPSHTLFPYTTLFRSHGGRARRRSFAQRRPACAPVSQHGGTARRGATGRRTLVEGNRAARRATGLPVRRRRCAAPSADPDRKSTRLNSSHVSISYAVF